MAFFQRLTSRFDEALPRHHQSILAILLLGLLAALALSRQDAARQTPVSPPAPTVQVLPAVTQPAEPQEPPTPVNAQVFLKVQSGDNLSVLFSKAGLPASDVYAVANSGPDADKLAQLYPGNELVFELSPEHKLVSLEVIKSPLESFVYTRDDNGSYAFSHVEREPKIEQVYKEAVITDSLFQAAQRGGIPAAMTMELAGIFGGVVDFIQDTQDGDSFNLLYEEQYLDGNFIGFGRILAAQFTNQGVSYTAVRYEDEAGNANFYNLAGESMRKAFLLNPVDFTRISDGFNLARRHPILNTIRAHKGTDYAAPKGTPVVATADGEVTFAARSGSFGKLVVIRHGSRFETKYAHLNDYAKGIKAGLPVRQGQVIGYVGATGAATGPHLHYEFLMDGVHRNSRTIHDQLPRATSITVAEMARFQQQTQRLVALLVNKGRSVNTLAQNAHAQE